MPVEIYDKIEIKRKICKAIISRFYEFMRVTLLLFFFCTSNYRYYYLYAFHPEYESMAIVNVGKKYNIECDQMIVVKMARIYLNFLLMSVVTFYEFYMKVMFFYSNIVYVQ